LHFVSRGNVVLDEERDAVERASSLAGRAFGVEGGGNLEEIGV
jgi:hypothetical protein